jgi:hypothetical protein
MTDKLSIANEMAQFDSKNRQFFDELSDEERKKFSPFLMIRYGSSVSGSRDLQEFYLIATNERLNKRFFAVNTTQHKKLQWLMATTVSPGLGNFRHNWIAPSKKQAGSGTIRKQLAELFPDYRDDELDLLAQITTKQELDTYLLELGQEKKK